MNQSEFETLMMAHDNLQRELADIKQRIGKDKHALIKSNISLNKRVQELEDKLARIRFVNNDYDKQNKRYREELDVIGEVINSVDNADEINNRILEALEESE